MFIFIVSYNKLFSLFADFAQIDRLDINFLLIVQFVSLLNSCMILL